MLKSLAHKDWPYTGTPNEWRGFVEARDMSADECKAMEKATAELDAEIRDHLAIALAREKFGVYQKQNFGPELP